MVNVVFCYMCPVKFGTDVCDVRHIKTVYMKKCCMNREVMLMIKCMHVYASMYTLERQLPSFSVSMVIGVLDFCVSVECAETCALIEFIAHCRIPGIPCLPSTGKLFLVLVL